MIKRRFMQKAVAKRAIRAQCRRKLRRWKYAIQAKTTQGFTCTVQPLQRPGYRFDPCVDAGREPCGVFRLFSAAGAGFLDLDNFSAQCFNLLSRRRKLHILRVPVNGNAHSFRCASQFQFLHNTDIMNACTAYCCSF